MSAFEDRDTAWFTSPFSVDEDEQRDAEHVAALEANAEATDDLAKAACWLAEADALRERWDQPRQRFSSLAEVAAALDKVNGELKVRAGEAIELRDADAIERLADSVSDAGSALQEFADALRDEHWRGGPV